KIFRRAKSAGASGEPMHLHRHQLDAIVRAQRGESYVLTTGTGSGKSLSYIVPIVDHVLRNPGPGVQAIVVYPMNALANSQWEELNKFLAGSGVTFSLYTGGQDLEAKKKVVENRPNILLTNYVMLELILTRPKERELVEAAKALKFVVF